MRCSQASPLRRTRNTTPSQWYNCFPEGFCCRRSRTSRPQPAVDWISNQKLERRVAYDNPWQRSTAFLMHRCKCLVWVREWKNPVTALLRISTSFKIVAKRPLSSTTCYAKQLHYTHYVTRDCLAGRSQAGACRLAPVLLFVTACNLLVWFDSHFTADDRFLMDFKHVSPDVMDVLYECRLLDV